MSLHETISTLALALQLSAFGIATEAMTALYSHVHEHLDLPAKENIA